MKSKICTSKQELISVLQNEIFKSTDEKYILKQVEDIPFVRLVFTEDLYKYGDILYEIMYTENKLVGFLKIVGFYDYADNMRLNYTLMSISVDKNYTRRGISGKLLDSAFSYLKNVKSVKTLYISPYTYEGFSYIKPKLIKLSEEYQIEIRDNNYII